MCSWNWRKVNFRCEEEEEAEYVVEGSIVAHQLCITPFVASLFVGWHISLSPETLNAFLPYFVAVFFFFFVYFRCRSCSSQYRPAIPCEVCRGCNWQCGFLSLVFLFARAVRLFVCDNLITLSTLWISLSSAQPSTDVFLLSGSNLRPSAYWPVFHR